MASFDGEQGRENGHLEIRAGVLPDDAHCQGPLGRLEPYNATAGGREVVSIPLVGGLHHRYTRAA